MGNKEALQLFGEKRIRTAWNQEEEKWYFSIVDVCEVLTDSKDYLTARKYWNKLKQRLIEEGNETVTNCHQLKLRAADGKMRQTDVADQQQLFRLIQSIPSPKAEPFKLWIAKVASERIDEIQDPELAILRGADYYRAKGYSESWINQRLQSIKMRKELTDEWKARGIQKEKEYAILTNEMTKAWSGLTVRENKDLKGLKKENLRDNMTDIELVLNMLAEVSTKALSQAHQPDSFSESKQIAREGGTIAGEARESIEKRVGRIVISSLNATDKPALDTGTQSLEIH